MPAKPPPHTRNSTFKFIQVTHMGLSVKCEISPMIGALMDAVLALYEWDLQLGTSSKHKGVSHKCLFTTPKAGRCLTAVLLVSPISVPRYV